MLLEGRVCVVSGAASKRGLGLATARLFARHGAHVAILDLDIEASREAVNALEGAGHLALRCDVTHRGECLAAMKAVLSEHGRIDVLVNNAGVTSPQRVMEVDDVTWDRVLDVNLRGTLHLTQAVVPAMRERRSGSIINMSSVSAQRGGGVFGGSHYAAAKGGILGYTKACARELGPDNIRVNAICPSLIDTDITAGKLDDAKRAAILGTIPLGRVGRAEEVAGCCLFLASDLSSYVTGSELDVNGGSHIH